LPFSISFIANIARKRPELKRDKTNLLLGQDLLLRKELILPVAARANLSRVIDLNMRQSLPAGGDDLIWRYVIEGRDKSDLKVSVFLLKKHVLDEAIGVVSKQGANLRAVRIADHTSIPPIWENQKKIDRPRRYWGLVATMLFVTIIGFISWTEKMNTSVLKQQITWLEQEKTDLSNQAVALRTHLDVEDTSFAAISRDMDIFRAEFQRLPILLELTETLSDETWISELAINDHNLQLSGFTALDVTEVMSEIRGLSWVHRVDLNGSVSFDSFSRRNRFDLTVSMRALSGMNQ
jgi:hypothetical protein